ncbi:MAG TPA: KpsF/GutQ family sugar-phosphate isomerase [Granulicella sp.]|jgi:arabinose-5-phosphate isomerase|nr:KpsF/GutQ family sugar-phosphate isomerase [Granulicella sp.]
MASIPSSPSDLVRVQARALLALAMRLDGRDLSGAPKASMANAFAQAVDLLIAAADARQRVVLLGIGKSGLIARKIAATLSSTGTPAQFLHPTEALHGDLGIVSAGDLVLALSSSGETEEILRLLPILKRLGSPLISLCGVASSTLAQASQVFLDASVTEEACALNLAPTASTTVMLALGDALAVEVSRRRNFQAEDFAELHPGGRLGRRLTRVRDLMHTGDALPAVAPNTPMPQVIYEMSRKKLGMTTVLAEPAEPTETSAPAENSTLLGIISDGDLRRLLERDGPNALAHTAAEIMNPTPLTIPASAFASAALALMEERKITSLVVTDEAGRAEGALHIHDVYDLYKSDLP